MVKLNTDNAVWAGLEDVEISLPKVQVVSVVAETLLQALQELSATLRSTYGTAIRRKRHFEQTSLPRFEQSGEDHEMRHQK